MKSHYICLLLSFSFLTGCTGFNSIKYQKEIGVNLSDSFASKETVFLYYNLKKLAERNIIFGHHHSTAYGVGWRLDSSYNEPRSDVKDVSNYFPGLYGWDFEQITIPGRDDDQWMKRLIMDAYRRGGINTVCWHYYNPVTGNNFYDTTIAVKHILPGGSHYKNYIDALDRIAEYVKNLVDEEGNLIPIIFRPFHEFDGSWFWWGKNFCTAQEFKTLWKTTVEYLRDIKKVKNFIYAFSPDRKFYSEDEYLERYPGDEYVDVLGMDNYYDFVEGGDGLEWIIKKLKIISQLAKKKNKIAAFTETGLEGIPESDWWTRKLFASLNDDSIKIAYMMVWRNANQKHHYAPYKGTVSANNFVEFSKQPRILFEDHLPDLYHKIIDEEAIQTLEAGRTLDLMKFLFSNYFWF